MSGLSRDMSSVSYSANHARNIDNDFFGELDSLSSPCSVIG